MQRRSIQFWLDWATSALTQSDSAKLDAKLLLCHSLDCQPVYLHTWPEKLIEIELAESFQKLVGERAKGRPIAHILGYREFWSLPLRVSTATLIPRPETETLVELALKLDLPAQTNALDLGTGTGAIALALASERPNWQIVGVDKQIEAVVLAQKNAEELDLTRVKFMQSHWFASIEPQGFDLIVSNPPYVESNSPYLQLGDVRFEPTSALTSGEDGLDDIRHLIATSREFLSIGGWFLLEHGFQQARAIQTLLKKFAFDSISTHQDLNQCDRVTLARRSN